MINIHAVTSADTLSSFILKIPNWEHYITFLVVNSRHWREINKTCYSPLMVFGDHVRTEWWMAEERAQQSGKMSWTGNRGSTRLMMLAVIICRCEWSEINHWGARLEWQEVRNGNDQTGGNSHELYQTFSEVDQQDEVRENNAAVHAPLCVSGQMLKRDCRTACALQLCWDLCSLWWPKYWIVYLYCALDSIGEEINSVIMEVCN